MNALMTWWFGLRLHEQIAIGVLVWFVVAAVAGMIWGPIMGRIAKRDSTPHRLHVVDTNDEQREAWRQNTLDQPPWIPPGAPVTYSGMTGKPNPPDDGTVVDVGGCTRVYRDGRWRIVSSRTEDDAS